MKSKQNGELVHACAKSGKERAPKAHKVFGEFILHTLSVLVALNL